MSSPLQDPGSSAVGPRLVAGGGPQNERRRGGLRQLILAVGFVQGVRPPHALAVPPALRGRHPVAQLRAAGGLRPARSAQPRPL